MTTIDGWRCIHLARTLTLIVRAIALGELVGVTAKRLLAREAILGVFHGVWLGLLVAAIGIVWHRISASR